jgi:hypothetical protein
LPFDLERRAQAIAHAVAANSCGIPFSQNFHSLIKRLGLHKRRFMRHIPLVVTHANATPAQSPKNKALNAAPIVVLLPKPLQGSVVVAGSDDPPWD